MTDLAIEAVVLVQLFECRSSFTIQRILTRRILMTRVPCRSSAVRAISGLGSGARSEDRDRSLRR